MMIWYLFLSCICVNGMHGYLLWSQRSERKWSISVHAIKSRKDYALYIAGHTLGGLFYVLFAKEFFVNTHNIQGLFYLSLVTYFFEILQALLPSKGKYEMPHSIAALIMWLTFVAAGLISIFTLDITTIARILAIIFYIPLLVMLVRAIFNRNKLYFYQMSMVLLFFAAMFSMVMGS